MHTNNLAKFGNLKAEIKKHESESKKAYNEPTTPTPRI